MDNQVDIMKDEIELLKSVPTIVKAQQIVGDTGSRESLFFFGRAKLRRSWMYEAAAFFLAAIIDGILILAALAVTILVATWL